MPSFTGALLLGEIGPIIMIFIIDIYYQGLWQCYGRLGCLQTQLADMMHAHTHTHRE